MHYKTFIAPAVLALAGSVMGGLSCDEPMSGTPANYADCLALVADNSIINTGLTILKSNFNNFTIGGCILSVSNMNCHDVTWKLDPNIGRAMVDTCISKQKAAVYKGGGATVYLDFVGGFDWDLIGLCPLPQA